MRQLATFLSLSYIISWLIWLPLYADQIGLHGLGKLPFQHALGAYGPMLAAWITMSIFRKSELPRLLKSMVSTKKIYLLLLSLTGPYLLFIVSAVVANVFYATPVDFRLLGRSSEFPEWGVLVVLLFNILTFGMGEETGWRGLALPLLQKKYNALGASTILTLFWACWHLPLFLYRPGYVHMGIADAIGWLMSLLAGSILLAWLYNSSQGNILVCAIFHATIDVVFSSPYADNHVVPIMGSLITICSLLVIVFCGYRNLSFSNKIESPL